MVAGKFMLPSVMTTAIPGITEKVTEGTPGHANEVQFIELSDGSVMLNARNQGGSKCRKIALSKDGGNTWSPTRDDSVLVDPVCQASLMRHPAARGSGERRVPLGESGFSIQPHEWNYSPES